MTSWTAIEAKCRELFGYTPSKRQLTFWWFGSMSHSLNKDRRERKEWIIREVGPWDVVIKLALRYTQDKGGFTPKTAVPEDINRFVYYLLWKSKVNRYAEAYDKKGKLFWAPTFWQWAIEHRDTYKPVLSQKGRQGMKRMKDVLQQLGDHIDD